jgi:hypothetical protein
MTYKDISYAYPSSANASKFKRSKEGCYTVGLCIGNNLGHENFGPFKTIQEAESYAESLPFEWHSLYKRFPHHGSKFGPPNEGPGYEDGPWADGWEDRTSKKDSDLS